MASRTHFTQMLLRHESTSDKEERKLILNRLRDERKATLIQHVQCKEPAEKAYLESQYRDITGILYTITEDPKYIQGVRGMQA